MNLMMGLANLAAQPQDRDLAFSALPDAPVLPVVERRRRLRHVLAVATTVLRRPGAARRASVPRPGTAC